MKTTDTMNSRGQVSPSFIDIRTGERVAWPARHNTLSYDAAHAMALAFGGDDSLVPNRVGLVYGPSGDTSFSRIDRDQAWDDLVYDLSSKRADVQVQPFSYSPSFVQIGAGSSGSSGSSGSLGSSESPDPSGDKQGWAVVFHAHSDSVTSGAIGSVGSSGSSGSGESGMIFTSGMYIFQAVLLNYSGGKYTVLARVSLDNAGTYYAKPENFEVALDWTVKFF